MGQSDEGNLPTISGSGSGGDTPLAGELPQIEGFEITGKLGEGGMGTVWRAVQLSTRREVALKLMNAMAFGSDKAKARFEREVELAARLEHPNIARVYDSGLRRQVYYYAMELIDGVHLDQHVEEGGLTQRQILELMRTVAQAVQHAHQRGVIHRDLKPSNIMVTKDGQPHVLDFGLAKAILEGEPGLTVSAQGDVAGTPAYMSPEQAAGQTDEIDTRSDVYNLGVILYRLLTGKSPHDLSGTRYEVLWRIAEDEVRRPRQANKGVDRELEALLLKTLSRWPGDRYSSAGDLAKDITNYLNGDPLNARKPTFIYFLSRTVRKRLVPVGIGTFLLLLLLGMAAFSYWRIATEKHRAEFAAIQERDARHQAEQNLAVLRVNEYRTNLAHADTLCSEGKVNESLDVLQSLRPQLRGWEYYHVVLRTTTGTATVPSVALKSPGVFRCLFTSDSTRLGTLGTDGMKVWDCRTGQKLLQVKHVPSAITCFDFSPDGHTVVAGMADGTIQLLDVQTGRATSIVQVDKSAVTAVAYDHHGSTVFCASKDKVIRAIDLRARSARWAMPLALLAKTIAMSHSGTMLAVGCTNRFVCLLDPATGKEIRRLTVGVTEEPLLEETHDPGVTAIVFVAGDTELLAVNDRGLAVVYNLAGQVRLAKLIDGVSAASNSEGQRFLTGENNGLVTIWHTRTGRQLYSWVAHHDCDSYLSVAMSPNNMLVASASQADGEVNLWRRETSFLIGGDVLGHFAISPIAFSPDGARCAMGGETLTVWNMRGNREVPIPRDSEPELNPRTMEEFRSSSLPARLPPEMQADPCSSWKVRRIMALDWSPDGKTIAGASYSYEGGGSPGQSSVKIETVRIKVWDAVSGTELLDVPAGNNLPCCLTFSPDGNILSWLSDGSLEPALRVRTLHVYNMRNQRMVLSRQLSKAVTGIARGHMGPEILVFGGSNIWPVNVATGLEGDSVVTGAGFLWEVVLSPDGQHMICRSDDRVGVWDWPRRHEKAVVECGWSRAVAISPDSAVLAVGGDDGQIMMAHVRSGKVLWSGEAPMRGIVRVAFSRDGRYLLCGSEDFRVKRWDVLAKNSGVAMPSARTKVSANEGASEAKAVSESGRELILNLGNNVTMKLMRVPAGSFTMGTSSGKRGNSDEMPRHEVAITRPFYMGIYEVTQNQYEAVIGQNPSEDKGREKPVACVTWEDAVTFCGVVSKRTGRSVRLPTEAEWEYACRAGSRTRFCFGDGGKSSDFNFGDLGKYAWFNRNTETTHPVGQKAANAWGLYDMHGNVSEWCGDWYSATYYCDSPASDPGGPTDGESHVARGGGYDYDGDRCTSAFRIWAGTGMDAQNDRGFRVVVEAK